MRIIYQFIIIICLMFIGCENNSNPISNKANVIIYKDVYKNKLEGFWLGQCIGNWTGLITEMDKIGIAHEGKGEGFYTRKNWGDKGFFWLKYDDFKRFVREAYVMNLSGLKLGKNPELKIGNYERFKLVESETYEGEAYESEPSGIGVYSYLYNGLLCLFNSKW